MTDLSSAEVARRSGISASTLRRWDRVGLIPRPVDLWTEREVSHVRMLVGLRDRGYSLPQMLEGVKDGTLAIGYIESFNKTGVPQDRIYPVREAARQLGIETELLRRFMAAFGLPATITHLTELELSLLRHSERVLNSGLPLVASLQLARVYGQALAQIADAEVRLVHLYVHEPMIRDGLPNDEITETLDSLASSLLPVASPILDLLHQHFLQHFIEQDTVGHLEQSGAAEARLGEMRVAIAFADLAGFTSLTEQEGDLEAVSVVERFFEQVETTLPPDARVIKTIGDAVMVVGASAIGLANWAVEFQETRDERPLPRISVHAGPAIFRDADYYGQEINRAARIVSSGSSGQVVVTDAMREYIEQAGLRMHSLGEFQLKGFEHAEELFVLERHFDD